MSEHNKLAECVKVIMSQLDKMGSSNPEVKIFGYGFAPYKPDSEWLEYMAYYTLVIGVALEKHGWTFVDLQVKNDNTHFALFVENKHYVYVD